MSTFLLELKRRNVIRIAGLYLAGAWLLVQVAGTVLPMFSAPAWVARGLITVLLIGFIPVLVFTWVFQWTPAGLMRETDVGSGQSIAPQSGRRIDRLIMVVLTLAIAYFAVDKFLLSPARETARMESARQEGRSEAIVQTHGSRSIAVLPFVDMSQAKDQEYFSDGITEELLNLLAKIPELRVISRTSAFSFKGKEIDIPTVAKQLNVAHVLEGSVRKAGNKVRVTAQLIEAGSDTHLWSETYDRPLDDIFAIQDDIAAAVVAQLKVKLLGQAPQVRKTDPKAYALYLQGEAMARRATTEAYAKSSELFKQALAIDPGYVVAWNRLLTNYTNQASRGLIPMEEGFRLAREAANKALAADPNYAETHANLSLIAMIHDGDLETAARHMQRALELEPANPTILSRAGNLAKSLGRVDQAVAVNAYTTARDPVCSNCYSLLCISQLEARRPNDAIAACRTALQLEPDRIVTHYTLATALMLKGDARSALVEIQREPFDAFRLFGLAMVNHSLGETSKSDAILKDVVAEYEKDAAYNIANIYAYRGDMDKAFEWLDKAVQYNDSALPSVAIDPLFASLHADPRWLPFLRKLGKAPEQLAAIKFKVELPGATAAKSPAR